MLRGERRFVSVFATVNVPRSSSPFVVPRSSNRSRLFRVADHPRPPSQARDAYFACLDVNGAKRTARSLRKAYEKHCPTSWVKHFDAKRDEEIKLRKLLETKKE